MMNKEQILKHWQGVQELFDLLKVEYPDWYASLRIPALELERRLKEFIKELSNE